MFKFFKHLGSGVKTLSILDWLREADKAYNYALQTHMLNDIGSYFTSEAMLYISNIVNSQQREYQGLNRYRKVDFKLLQESDKTMVYRKTVTYDNVKITHGVVVPIGDAYIEDWFVTKNTTRTIRKIKRVS